MNKRDNVIQQYELLVLIYVKSDVIYLVDLVEVISEADLVG